MKRISCFIIIFLCGCDIGDGKYIDVSDSYISPDTSFPHFEFRENFTKNGEWSAHFDMRATARMKGRWSQKRNGEICVSIIHSDLKKISGNICRIIKEKNGNISMNHLIDNKPVFIKIIKMR